MEGMERFCILLLVFSRILAEEIVQYMDHGCEEYECKIEYDRPGIYAFRSEHINITRIMISPRFPDSVLHLDNLPSVSTVLIEGLNGDLCTAIRCNVSPTTPVMVMVEGGTKQRCCDLVSTPPMTTEAKPRPVTRPMVTTPGREIPGPTVMPLQETTPGRTTTVTTPGPTAKLPPVKATVHHSTSATSQQSSTTITEGTFLATTLPLAVTTVTAFALLVVLIILHKQGKIRMQRLEFMGLSAIFDRQTPILRRSTSLPSTLNETTVMSLSPEPAAIPRDTAMCSTPHSHRYPTRFSLRAPDERE